MESAVNGNNIYMEIDSLLQLAGEFGKFQQLVDAMFFFMNLAISYHLLIMYFSTLNPPWKCVMDASICTFNGTMPSDDHRRCSMPRDEWEYIQPPNYSIVTQFDIHCENEWLIGLINSIFFVGWGLGAGLLGWIADRYGRKRVYFPSFSVLLLVGFCTPFMPNVYLVIACRFIVGFFLPGTAVQGFIIMSEIVSCKYRAFAGLINAAVPIALRILVLKAYFVRQWKLLNIICTAPYVFVLAFYKFIPESIRWLQQQGKSEEVMCVFRRMAYWNRKELPASIKLAQKKDSSDSPNPLDLFRTRTIAFSTCAQGLIWLVTATGFYALYLAADDLGGSPYRDEFILIVTEIPAVFLSIYFADKFGRRKTSLISLSIGGAGCLAVAFIPVRNSKLKVMRVIFAMIGKFAIAMAFDTLYIWSAEIFPTNVRSEGMGFLQITAHLGSGSGPWIIQGMRAFGRGAPFIVLGIPSLLCAVLGIFLPETQSENFLDTVEEFQVKSSSIVRDDIEMKSSTQFPCNV